MDKCAKCKKKKRIISYHTYMFEQCSDCNYLCINADSLSILANQVLKDVYNSLRLILYPDYLKKLKVDKFIHYMTLGDSSLKQISSEESLPNICDKCAYTLMKMQYLNIFDFYYCEQCNMIYFKKSDLDILVNYIVNKVKKTSFWKERFKHFIKGIFKNE